MEAVAAASLELSTEEAAWRYPPPSFRDATSLGASNRSSSGVGSLIWRGPPLLLRVSVGLEEVEHLKADPRRDFGGELALQNVCFYHAYC